MISRNRVKWIRGKPNPLSKAAWGSLVYIDRELKHPPEEPRSLLSLTINNECNLKCPHCVEDNYSRGKDKYELLRRRIEEFPDRFVWYSISGKEPTLSPERSIEMAEIGRKKADRVILMTNGIEFIRDLQIKLEGKVDYVDISVDGILAYKNPDKKVWENIGFARDRFEKIAVITTLMGGEDRNYNNIGDLIDRVSGDFNGQVAQSIGFYLGWPGDTRLLNEEQVIQAISQIAEKDFKTTIQIPPMYSRFVKKIFAEFGLRLENVGYDSATGIPSYDLNGHKLVVASHLETPLIGLRTEVDGKVYYGCSHLMLNGNASRFSIGDLEKDSVNYIINRVEKGECELIQAVSSIDKSCFDSDCFKYCRGGDRLGGYIHTKKPIDNFCRIGECK